MSKAFGWFVFLTLIIFLAGCKQNDSKNTPAFAILIAKPQQNQFVHFIGGKQAITTVSKNSIISAMVINNPILAGKDAILAIAIENRGDSQIEIKWDNISFFNPSSNINLLPVNKIKEYFQKPNRCKPILNSSAFKDEMLKYGVIQKEPFDMNVDEFTAGEKALLKVLNEIKNDLCYTRLPNNKTLLPNSVTVGYMVVQIPKKHFSNEIAFMLKIPIENIEYKLEYSLQPLN